MENVCFAYPSSKEGGPVFALENVSLRIDEGGLLGILGPNGAGKSTLLRLVIKALTPGAGKIFLGGVDIQTLSQREVARWAAWVPQDIDSLFTLSVEEMVGLGRYCRQDRWGRLGPEDRRQVTRALEETDLLALRHRLVHHLSGGERHRVLLARALAQDPKVLLLDEPTTHLDPGHQAEMVAVIDQLRRDRGLAVAAILHDISLAYHWCPSVILLKSGKTLASGSTAEVVTEEHLQSLYGIPARVIAPMPGAPGSIHFINRSIQSRTQP